MEKRDVGDLEEKVYEIERDMGVKERQRNRALRENRKRETEDTDSRGRGRRPKSEEKGVGSKKAE